MTEVRRGWCIVCYHGFDKHDLEQLRACARAKNKELADTEIANAEAIEREKLEAML